jgi:predicted dehydrogenase
MGEVHLSLINDLKEVNVVGVADTYAGRAKALAARGKIAPAFRDLEALLEQARPDAVHIVTPPATHASLACTALRAGCHVFVEKPMALTAQEASLMIAAATENDRILTVGHNHLFDPAVREAHLRVTQNQLGQLLGLDIFHGALPASSAWLQELPSGPWINDIDHLLYLSQMFMGDPQAVRAIGYSNGERSKVTELRVVMQHRKGSSSLTYSSAAAPFRIRLTLFGTKRTLEVDLIAGILVEWRDLAMHRWLRKGVAALDAASQLVGGAGRNAVRVLLGRERGWAGLGALLEAFYKAIREGGSSPVPAAQGLRVVELSEEIRRLLKESCNS